MIAVPATGPKADIHQRPQLGPEICSASAAEAADEWIDGLRQSVGSVNNLTPLSTPSLVESGEISWSNFSLLGHL
jgi:hypothetical protein